MAQAKSLTIETLQQFVKFLEDSSKASEQVHWYRGCGNASHKLLPTLYRHQRKKTIEERLQLERELLTWFKQKSVPHQTRELRNDWEYLFFMQHFRVPTRLLDWTENPFIGLYFALTQAHSKWTNGVAEYQTDAAVWVLKPGVWNEKALEDIHYPQEILSLGDERLKGHEPGTGLPLKPLPVAMYGTHNTPRIVAQRGTFVIFGTDMSSMQEIYGKHNFPTDVLVKLEIPVDHIAGLLASLVRVGVTDSVVFPDLEGLAMEAKRHFGFKVQE